MRYSEDAIEEVRMKNDVVDVISGYVKLQKKGSNYFGLCPFHNEKSPSFSVSPAKQMYYCFGCGAGGNAITFVMEYENYSFSEALKILADRAGVKLPVQEYSKEAKAQEDLRAVLLEINKLAASYFYYQLKNPQGELGYKYLRDRQLSDDTIVRFGLGYSNKTSDDLYRYLKGKGYDDAILKQTGLVTIEERGTYDKFWNRVMFPIMDVNNRVIGFGGRVMGTGEPKYLNSPETKLFDKSRNLYGLNYARLSREKYILICEGYIDVIALHQAGFTNAVASLGTAFTLQHAQLLKRYTDKVILTYDNDGAGIKAALRAIPILKEVGMSIRVLNMQPYKDPDDFIKDLGADAFEERIKEARNSFLFEIDVLKKDYKMDDPEQKTAFYNQVSRKLLEFPEALERENYLEAVSREFFINYEDLKRLVNRLGATLGAVSPASKREEEKGFKDQKKKDKEDGVKQSQRLLLTWLIENPILFDKIHGVITPEDFIEELYHKVAQMVFDGHAAGTLNPAEILNHFINDDDQYRAVAGLFHASLKESPNNEEQKKAFSETIMKVKKNSLDNASRHAEGIEELQRIIKEQAALKDLHISLD
ncbi:DNA primase [Lacrimispora algidixylanolytica]|uniref:DNA primase n=1 Tax=Lacrimispora algidixylanolytica TaxID=94868 RepID=A0A419SSC0_9FIRM|nr:DNA primase [Lacrimispora algidixylanolytica]RKD28149.1 DNA primase [Lacrimispora algidixylanolytica]